MGKVFQTFNPGITVGSSTFTDLVCMDDTALLLPLATDVTTSHHSRASAILLHIQDSASLGQRQNYTHRTLVQFLNHQIFQWMVIRSNQSRALFYLGSLQSSDGQCRLGVTCCISLACAVMTSLKQIWSDKCVTLDTQLCIYQTLVCLCYYMPLLYVTDTWTLLSANM